MSSLVRNVVITIDGVDYSHFVLKGQGPRIRSEIQDEEGNMRIADAEIGFSNMRGDFDALLDTMIDSTVRIAYKTKEFFQGKVAPFGINYTADKKVLKLKLVSLQGTIVDPLSQIDLNALTMKRAAPLTHVALNAWTEIEDPSGSGDTLPDPGLRSYKFYRLSDILSAIIKRVRQDSSTFKSLVLNVAGIDADSLAIGGNIRSDRREDVKNLPPLTAKDLVVELAHAFNMVWWVDVPGQTFNIMTKKYLLETNGGVAPRAVFPIKDSFEYDEKFLKPKAVTLSFETTEGSKARKDSIRLFGNTRSSPAPPEEVRVWAEALSQQASIGTVESQRHMNIEIRLTSPWVKAETNQLATSNQHTGWFLVKIPETGDVAVPLTAEGLLDTYHRVELSEAGAATLKCEHSLLKESSILDDWPLILRNARVPGDARDVFLHSSEVDFEQAKLKIFGKSYVAD